MKIGSFNANANMVLLALSLGACSQLQPEVTEGAGDVQPSTGIGATTMAGSMGPSGGVGSSTTAMTGELDTTAGVGPVTTEDTGEESSGTTAGTTTGGRVMMETEVVEAGPGLMLPVVDDGYNGMIGSMSCEGLQVDGDGIDIIVSVMVEIGLEHTYVSDIVMKLVSPEGSIITLVSQPTADELADDGVGLPGSSGDLSSMHRIRFVDGGPTDAELMGAGLDDNQTVCLSDGLCEYAPNPGAALPGSLSDLVGEDSSGAWRVCVGDVAPQDPGLIDFARLTIEQSI